MIKKWKKKINWFVSIKWEHLATFIEQTIFRSKFKIPAFFFIHEFYNLIFTTNADIFPYKNVSLFLFSHSRVHFSQLYSKNCLYFSENAENMLEGCDPYWLCTAGWIETAQVVLVLLQLS